MDVEEEGRSPQVRSQFRISIFSLRRSDVARAGAIYWLVAGALTAGLARGVMESDEEAGELELVPGYCVKGGMEGLVGVD